ncbi:MAG: sensor histidine kinase [Gemmatimonadaceae bacterium]
MKHARLGRESTQVPVAGADEQVSRSAFAQILERAAARACESLASSAKRPAEEMRRQIAPVIGWLRARSAADESRMVVPPPVVSEEVIDRLRSQLLRELDPCATVEGANVVRLMLALEELVAAWRRTDRGKFMMRLTGSESANALVAIAHDIRSPLASILILVDSLRRGRDALNTPIRDRQLGLIYGAAQGLATLAADLIDAAGGAELQLEAPRAFSLVETMRSVGAIVQPVAEEKGLELRIEAPVVDARVGHPSWLHRVLLNLTCNALRYTENGSVMLACRESAASQVTFLVSDTGKGLPPAVRASLFDAFRPDERSLRFSSSGLGLATVRTLLASMNSALQVESSEASGTTFSFALTLPPAQARDAGAGHHPRPGNSSRNEDRA